MTQLDTGTSKPKLGRKRDLTRDPEILEAALDVLAEAGYDGMTIDMVAARAKAGKATLYRRWSSKGELVVDAIGCLKAVNLETLPDTGTLRGDFVAMIRPHTIEESERKLKIMTGMVSMLAREPELAENAMALMSEPRIEANRIFLRRAIARGEISATTDIDAIASVSQAMATYRVMILRKPVDRAFILSVLDGIVLPAVGLAKADA
jgi:AcrR family transcriptional regulator